MDLINVAINHLGFSPQMQEVSILFRFGIRGAHLVSWLGIEEGSGVILPHCQQCWALRPHSVKLLRLSMAGRWGQAFGTDHTWDQVPTKLTTPAFQFISLTVQYLCGCLFWFGDHTQRCWKLLLSQCSGEPYCAWVFCVQGKRSACGALPPTPCHFFKNSSTYILQVIIFIHYFFLFSVIYVSDSTMCDDFLALGFTNLKKLKCDPHAPGAILGKGSPHARLCRACIAHICHYG